MHVIIQLICNSFVPRNLPLASAAKSHNSVSGLWTMCSNASVQYDASIRKHDCFAN
jgi:hypothetical protein